MIVYPSDALASETNLTKINPLIKRIPQLKAELDRPRSYRADRYAFSNSTIYFQGAGSKIVSKSCKIAIGDEVDVWPVIGKLDNVADLKKRTRSYNSSITFLVCTPTEQNGKIWKQFLKSSKGYWHLRCQHCGKLSMRSCDIHNLQFETEYNKEQRQHIVKPESIRLVCPKCGFEHHETMKHDMNVQGGYIHEIPELLQDAPRLSGGSTSVSTSSIELEGNCNSTT